MAKKDKPKKISVKKERYSKFRKEKTSSMNLMMPDLDDDQQRLKRNDEQRINFFLRNMRRVPERFVVERRAKSKR